MTSNPERELNAYLAAHAAHADRDGIGCRVHTYLAADVAHSDRDDTEPPANRETGIPLTDYEARLLRGAVEPEPDEDIACITCDPCRCNVSVTAPAGLPLHEPTDRDADNVPSDRERAYAEAFRARKGPRCAECVELDDWSDCAECDAVVAVEVAEREQAELRAESDARLANSERRKAQRDEADAEVRRLRATIARVEALRDEWAAHGEGSAIENVMGRQSVTVDTAVRMLDAALRGPEPTDAP